MRSLLTALLCVICVVIQAIPAAASITIVLRNSFINQYANRATINANFHVDAAAPRPHPNASDGDEHAAGISPQIGLVTVIEIMNANLASESAPVADLEGAEGKTIAVTGFWRIWAEHGGSSDFVQFGSADPVEDTNPPHVFEIHPILSIDGMPLQDSLQKIEGYDPKDPVTAFQAYDRTRCVITGGSNTTTITTEMIGYNYVRFQVALTAQSTFKPTDDGGEEFFAQVQDPEDGDLIANKVRMIVAPGTAIAQRLSTMHKGDSVVVWGIPRIDLSLVKYRAANKKASQWSLPYEMMLVAPDSSTPSAD
jgi:hypothetical protein